MKNLVAFPILGLMLILQMAVISQVSLLSGAADLMLLVLVSWALQPQVESAWHWGILGGMMVAFASGLPFYVPIISYLIAVGLARFVLGLVWQMPMLALFSVVFFSTFLMHLFTFLVLWLGGTAITFTDMLTYISLPSVFLNLLLVLPVHGLVRDLAGWVYPVEEMA